MPTLKTTLYKPHRGWTPIPNYVLDKLMPDLTDSELRVVLVVLRMTAGWRRPDAPTVLSYRKLKALTGRESAAISKALKLLVTKGLVHKA